MRGDLFAAGCRCASGPLKNEALGDIVRVVLDEGFFYEQREIVLGKLEPSALANLLEQTRRNRMRHVCHKPTVPLVKNVFFFT